MTKTNHKGQFQPPLAIRDSKGKLVAVGYKTLANRKIELFSFRDKKTLTMSKRHFECNYRVEDLV